MKLARKIIIGSKYVRECQLIQEKIEISKSMLTNSMQSIYINNK